MNEFESIMVDIETLGVSSTSVITQIGACYFNRYTGEVGEKFLMNIDISSALDAGLTVDGDTLKWWFKQPKQTFVSTNLDIPTANLDTVLRHFNVFATGAKTVWSHATFDFPIIMEAYKRVGMKTPFNYKQARDIRTLNDLAAIPKADMPEMKEKKTHNALDDCLYQVEYCTVYFNKLKHEE